jgi:hypothetical protein
MQVTITAREGIDTEHAVVHVAHLRSDAEAYCREYENTTSKACIDEEMKQTFPAQIEADCTTGDFINLGKQHRRFGGRNPNGNPTYLIIDKEAGEPLDSGSASGYDVDLGQISALCPALVNTSQTAGNGQQNGDSVSTIANVVTLLDSGKMPSWADEQFFVVAKPYATRELLTAIHDGGEIARKTGQNIWDADIFTGAKGVVRAKLFKATVSGNDGRRATVIAEIGTTDTDTEPKAGAKLQYDMRREDGAWKIDDMRFMEDWAKDLTPLKETFEGAGQMAGIEPATGDAQQTDPKGLQSAELRSMMFQAVSLAVFRPHVHPVTDSALSRIPPEQLRTVSDMLLSTSMSFPLDGESGEYTLLYNWFADLLILVKYKNGLPIGVGLASADQLAKDFYRPSADKTAIETMLAARPALLHALQRDLPHMAQDDIDTVFNHFLVTEGAGQHTRESILGMAVLLKYALAHQCWPDVKKYLSADKASIAQTLHTAPEDLGELYSAGAMPLADGVAFAFSDAATNKRVGYLFVSPPAGNVHACQPHGVVTAVF